MRLGHPGLAIGLDEHRSGGNIDLRNLDEHGIEAALYGRWTRAQQAVAGQRRLDLLELHLISRHRLNVRAMTADPRENLVPLLDKLLAQITNRRDGRRHAHRFDAIEHVRRRERGPQLQALVAFDGGGNEAGGR